MTIEGWTGRKCPTCKGTGIKPGCDTDTTACTGCGGTGDEHGPLTKAQALLDLARTVQRGNTDYKDLEAMAREVLALPDDPAPRVLISVSGGVAEFESHGPVGVEIIDFDNLEADGLDRDEREARYQQDKHWLETGELPPDDDQGDEVTP